jgi:hypothetical protein
LNLRVVEAGSSTAFPPNFAVALKVDFDCFAGTVRVSE